MILPSAAMLPALSRAEAVCATSLAAVCMDKPMFRIGLWLPFAGEVAWEIDGKEEVYWQGRIKTWETH